MQHHLKSSPLNFNPKDKLRLIADNTQVRANLGQQYCRNLTVMGGDFKKTLDSSSQFLPKDLSQYHTPNAVKAKVELP